MLCAMYTSTPSLFEPTHHRSPGKLQPNGNEASVSVAVSSDHLLCESFEYEFHWFHSTNCDRKRDKRIVSTFSFATYAWCAIHNAKNYGLHVR